MAIPSYNALTSFIFSCLHSVYSIIVSIFDTVILLPRKRCFIHPEHFYLYLNVILFPLKGWKMTRCIRFYVTLYFLEFMTITLVDKRLKLGFCRQLRCVAARIQISVFRMPDTRSTILIPYKKFKE